MLLALLERPGEIVSKDALAARMWPDRTVAECNLRWQVASLRRRLRCNDACRYIATVSGRGYRFVCHVRSHDPASAPAPIPLRRTSPSRYRRPIGREQEIARIGEAVARKRVVTVTGPGGIGKTLLAVAAAQMLEPRFTGGAVYVDLASATGPQEVAPMIARALALPPTAGNNGQAMVAALRDRQLLLVLDTCEHVLDAVVEIAAGVAESPAGATLLAASRAPLALAGEVVIRVRPLAVPPEGEPLSQDEVGCFGAVALFLDRLDAHAPRDTDSLLLIAKICRRLGGHPLALDLAAGQVEALGLKSLATLLDDKFVLTMSTARAAVPRHRSLEAAFASSYDRLDACEQWLFRQLSCFEGWFGLAAVHAFAPGRPPGERSPGTLLASLVTKSMLATEEGENGFWFHLQGPMRAFAADLLARASEREDAARRHARCVLAILEQGAPLPFIDLGNIGTALLTAHADPEQRDLAIPLALAAAPFWAQQGRVEQCATELRRALTIAERVAPATRMALQFELVGALGAIIGQGQELTTTAHALILSATVLDSSRHLLRGFWALWLDRINSGDARGALAFAEQFEALAVTMPDRSHSVTADRLIGITLHLLGNQHGALERLDRTLAYFAWPERSLANLPYQYDQRILVLAYRARIALLLGQSDGALRMAAAALAEAEDMRHSLSMIYVLASSYCPIALLLGRNELAERMIAKLVALAEAEAIPTWYAVAHGLAGWLAASRGTASSSVLIETIARLRSRPFGPLHALALGSLAGALAELGHASEAAITMDGTIGEADQAGAHWCLPELLRIRASISTQGSDALLDKARDQARDQDAFFWESRINMTRTLLVGATPTA
ncbi:winged helix-turn-helix domain-containing protein [Sphingomonas sp. JC676]|nr:winged helix-turn-helix domain-containing protein [Sphingomonas sp. JC676]